MTKYFSYFVAKANDPFLIIAAFIDINDAKLFVSHPYVSKWGYVVFNDHGVVVFIPTKPLMIEPLQRSDTPSS